MKVLFVSSGNSKYSISPIVRNQGLSLKDQGVDVEFFTIKGKGFSAYFKYLFILRSKLKNASYDIIHAHYGLSGIVGWLAKRKEKIIVSFMGSDLLGVNNFDKRLLFSQFIKKLNIIFSSRFYDHIIVKSDEMLNVLKNSSKASICPNGVNLDGFLPVKKNAAIQKTGFSDGDINIIFVSDPSRAEKNFPLARQAINILCNDSIKLHVINNLKFEDLKYYYSAADLLIMTSLHEGSPNVVKEAMACDCPVVSTDIGDVRELFGDEEGYYITSFVPEDVAEKVELAIKFRRTFGLTRGREQIISLGLDGTTVARKILKIYERVNY